VARVLDGRDAHPRPRAKGGRRHHPRAGPCRGGTHWLLLLSGRAENAADHDGQSVRVAFLAYTELTNGIPSPHPWSVNRARAAQILSDARRARRDGARVVIVNLHWGDEDLAQPSSFQLALAKRLTRFPDITAVVG
jgi:hypothetical protein